MLEPTALASLGGTALAARCEDIDRLVRRAALESLAHLEPLQLCAHDDALVGRLRDVDWAVREAALRVLSQLPPQELGANADALAERLDDSEWLVRRQAVMALSRTPPEQLARHLASLLVRLEDSYRDELGVMPVRVAVVKVLGKLPPALLNSGAASSLVRRLKDIDPTVRRAALDALAHLPPRALATHGPTVNAMLADCHAGVRVGAARFLARLPPATLERHTDALLLAATTDDAQPPLDSPAPDFIISGHAAAFAAASCRSCATRTCASVASRLAASVSACTSATRPRAELRAPSLSTRSFVAASRVSANHVVNAEE
jgi:HEAT repeat protein